MAVSQVTILVQQQKWQPGKYRRGMSSQFSTLPVILADVIVYMLLSLHPPSLFATLNPTPYVQLTPPSLQRHSHE